MRMLRRSPLFVWLTLALTGGATAADLPMSLLQRPTFVSPPKQLWPDEEFCKGIREPNDFTIGNAETHIRFLKVLVPELSQNELAEARKQEKAVQYRGDEKTLPVLRRLQNIEMHYHEDLDGLLLAARLHYKIPFTPKQRVIWLTDLLERTYTVESDWRAFVQFPIAKTLTPAALAGGSDELDTMRDGLLRDIRCWTFAIPEPRK